MGRAGVIAGSIEEVTENHMRALRLIEQGQQMRLLRRTHGNLVNLVRRNGTLSLILQLLPYDALFTYAKWEFELYACWVVALVCTGKEDHLVRLKYD